MKFSIRSRMMLLLSFILIILSVILGVFIFFNVNHTFIPMTIENNQKLVQVEADELGRSIEDYSREIGLISKNNAFKTGNWDLIKQELVRIVDGYNPDFDRVTFEDIDGNYYTSDGLEGAMSKDSAYYQAIINDGNRTYIGQATVSEISGSNVFIVASAITNLKDDTIGIISSEISVDKLRQIVSNVKLTNDSEAFIVDGSGLVIAHPNLTYHMNLNLLNSSSSSFQGFDAVGNQIVTGSSGIQEVVDSDGTKLTIIYNPIPNTPNWGIAISIPSIVLVETSNLQIILPVFIGVVLVLFIIMYVFYGFISRPIKKMAKHINTLANQDFSVEVPRKLLKRKDEIGFIANSMNKMSKHNISLALNIIHETNWVKENLQIITNKYSELVALTKDATAATEEVSKAWAETAVTNHSIISLNNVRQLYRPSQSTAIESYMDYDNEMWNFDEADRFKDKGNSMLSGQIHNIANTSRRSFAEIQIVADHIIEAMDSLIYSSEEAFHLIKYPVDNETVAKKRETLYNKEDKSERISNEKGLTYSKSDDKKATVEDYKMLQLKIDTKLQEESLKVVAVTSVLPFEKKSEHVYHIAESFVLNNKKVLIIDCNNNNFKILQHFDIVTDVVISSVTGENSTYKEIFNHIFQIPKIKGLDIIPVGSVLTDKDGVLNVDRIKELVDKVREDYDSILIDSPSAGNVTDGVKLSLIADGTVIVVRSGKTPKASAKKLNDMLNAVNANVLGVIFDSE